MGNGRKMYIACARTTMEYRGSAWWKGQKGLAERMDKENERGMRKIGGHLRTAPEGAVMVEGDMAPTKERMDMKQKRNVIRRTRKSPEEKTSAMI